MEPPTPPAKNQKSKDEGESIADTLCQHSCLTKDPTVWNQTPFELGHPTMISGMMKPHIQESFLRTMQELQDVLDRRIAYKMVINTSGHKE